MNITDEMVRSALATAIVRAGFDEADDSDDAVSLFEWHHCFDTPACGSLRTPPAPCACSGVPYLSEAVWSKVEPVVRLIAAQALREDEERTEWGVRWHGAHVAHGTGADGLPLYDEVSARVTAASHANAVAVRRRAAGPWLEAGERSQNPPCCNAPNMVWEHSRGPKDHFRCKACGGGMTKARAT